ncbi:hypothetical protein [Plantactinospora sp. CA-290183]|uniref:hypothetical protein n=1 Tax=Plantactinospora sp. CA-290183 TaxID=3240006 RepID=UPI003D8F404C
MWFFRRRSAAEKAETGPRTCVFCGADGVRRLSDTAYGAPHGYYCRSCEESYFQLISRFRHVETPGHRPWLAPDAGTERPLSAASEPFDAVHAVVDELVAGIGEVPPAAARIAALRLGVYGAEIIHSGGSRAAAVEAVSTAIADDLAEHHEELQEYFGGRDYRSCAVALFGAGSGILFQQVTTDGDWLRQYCFLIDTGHAVHRYASYDR